MEIKQGGPPNLFRYRSDNQFTIDELQNNYIYFSDREELNDPYDSTSELIKLTDDPEELQKIYDGLIKKLTDPSAREFVKRKYTPENIGNFITEYIDPFLMQFGIACFSIKPVVLPLWVTYSNNYKGVCLQFNSDYDQVFFNELRPVLYESNLSQVEFNPFSDSNELFKLFFRKSELWSKEFELRLVKKHKGRLEYRKESLRSVILGYNIESDFKNMVIQAVRSNFRHVIIYQMIKPKILNTVSFKIIL